ncbi:hypothetical protein GCM10009839_21900 [Catenulispora yoronensis]|uniref:HTH cro/C1-type domain-containing protein n=1 Tax=Catenulispora yoronensis TaxID=450799 RepID=A0ABN2TXR3_9ACTN
MAVRDGGAFGRELRRLRLTAGMSQAELANVLHFSKSYLSKVENGAKPATMDLARRCEAVLGAGGTLVALCEAAAAAAAGTTAAATSGAATHSGQQGRVARSPARASLPMPRQLPARPRYLIGRGSELKMLTALADAADGHRAQFTVITGPAGIGKTALAISWAHRVASRFPDGQLYVNLRGFAPAGALVGSDEALRGFLDTLGVPPGQVPSGVNAQAALFRSLTAARRMLVVLDNARDADHVRPLFPAGDGCVAVVTSRSDLAGLVAEGADAVAPGLLTSADAEELLAERLGPGRLAAERSAARDLIEMCGGLPLAVNIVAARAAAYAGKAAAPTLNDHAESMRAARSRLDELSTGDLTTDVRAVFSWSYRMLSPSAAALFRLLALHPGPECSVAAAVSLFGQSFDRTNAALAELSAAHLIAEHASHRYGFHDLLRVYAAELVSEVDDVVTRNTAIERLLEHYLHTAQAATVCFVPAWVPLPLAPLTPGVVPEGIATGDDAQAWFETEFQVLLGVIAMAVASGFDRYAWQLPWTLRTFFDRRGHWREMEQVSLTALAAAQRLSDVAAEATARRGLGRAYLRLRDYDAALIQARHALVLHEQDGDRLGQANVHHDLALLAEQRGDQALALHHAQQALGHFEAVGGPAAQANSLNTVGWFHAMVGDHGEALECCTRALELFHGLGDVAGEAGTWDSIGFAHHCLGDYEQAATAYRASIEGYRRIGDRFYEAGTLVRLGDTSAAAGDPEAAGRSWRLALAILDELAHPDAEEVAERLRGL